MTPSQLMLHALTRTVEGKASSSGRNHDCSRCSKVRDEIEREVPGWRVPQAERFIGTGGRAYWTDLCAQCAHVEREERISRAVANGEHRDVAARRFGINRRLLEKRAIEVARMPQALPFDDLAYDPAPAHAFSDLIDPYVALDARRAASLRALESLPPCPPLPSSEGASPVSTSQGGAPMGEPAAASGAQ